MRQPCIAGGAPQRGTVARVEQEGDTSQLAMQASLHTVQLTTDSSRAFCTNGVGVRDGEAAGLSHIRLSFNLATLAGARDSSSRDSDGPLGGLSPGVSHLT